MAAASPLTSRTHPSFSGLNEIDLSDPKEASLYAYCTETDLTHTILMIGAAENTPLCSSRVVASLIDLISEVVRYRSRTSELLKKTLTVARHSLSVMPESQKPELEKSMIEAKGFITREILVIYPNMIEALKSPEDAPPGTASDPNHLSLTPKERQPLLDQIQKHEKTLRFRWNTWKLRSSLMSKQDQHIGGLSKVIEFLDMETEDLQAILKALSIAEKVFQNMVDMSFVKREPLPRKDLKERSHLSSFLKGVRYVLSKDVLTLARITQDMLRIAKEAFPPPSLTYTNPLK